MELIEICHAGNRSGNARLRQQPGQGYSGWRCAVSFRHLVERAQDSETALVQIFLHERPSRALGQIRFRTVLARKKSTGQRKVRNHADVFAEAKGRQFRFEARPLAKVVVRLQTREPRQTLFLTDLERFFQSLGGVVRCPNRTHFSLLD